MNITIRPSSIGTFLDCSAKFKFQSIDKVQVPKALALAFGSAIHKPLEINYTQKKETQQDLPTEQMVDEFSTAFEIETETVEPTEFKEEPKGQVKDMGVRIIKTYHATISPKIQPQHTELRLQAEIEGLESDIDITLSGQIDLIDSNNFLIDHKTTKRTPSGISEGYVLQQTSYKLLAEAHGIEIQRNMIDYLVKKTQPDIKRFEVTPQPDFLSNILNIMISTISNETYTPNRTGMLCSRKYCNYWQICEKKYGGRVKD